MWRDPERVESGVQDDVALEESMQDRLSVAAPSGTSTWNGRMPASCSINASVARMAAWAREVGPRDPTVFDNIEVMKNLPPSWMMTASAHGSR